MDPYLDLAIGKTIKELRGSLGISQKELAKDICTQSLISHIESGSNIPNSVLLKLIAEKLGITLDGLLLMSENPTFDQFKKVESKVMRFIEANDYKNALRIIEFEKSTPTYENGGKVKQFFLWAEGVCHYYLTNDFTLAMRLLEQALNSTNNLIFSYQDAQILNSQGILYAEESMLEESTKTFKSILAIKDKVPSHILSISPLLPKVYYNLAKVITMQGKYEESIKYCQEGISYSENMESISVLGELYFQIGLNYEKMQDYKQALLWLKKSQEIYKVKVRNPKWLTIITDKIDEVQFHLK
ncbi:hypothetical protein CQS04_09675 [Chryseomicrobium excrementi]|uniref:HTH cro/C1-type domain-containing protein n=1 Tax=Chryseomicrobium excrementi TaxID=2041346 RepID=A0A2M9EY81_9BACL|nr:helix-turn-helix domain-containing protein [Chryseomicrobium excrementi]PJK16173.1 hypothetical protein CQS04_09675 [Chryseomicrobium excrementi]